MEEDEDYVETSDVEELAELEKEPMLTVYPRSREPLSPRRAGSPSIGEDLPRKRAKFFHQLEDASMANPSSPAIEDPVTLDFLPSPQQRSSSPSNAGSLLVRLHSPIHPCRSPSVESPPKDNTPEHIVARSPNMIPVLSTELNSTEDDPLLLQSPRQSQMLISSQLGEETDNFDNDFDVRYHDGEDDAGFSPEGSPFPEAQIPPDLFSEEELRLLDPEYEEAPGTSDTDGHTTEDPSTTPPITLHPPPKSPWRSPRSSPDPLALGSQGSHPSSLTHASSIGVDESRDERSRGLDVSPHASSRTRNSLEQDAQPGKPQSRGLDELLMFSPTKPAPEVDEHSNQSSPLSEKENLFGSPHRPAPSRSQSPRELIRPPHITRLPEVEDENETQKGIYTLRRRRPAQKNPYTTESLRYAAQMKDIPEAYVGLREIRRELEEANARGTADAYEEDDEGIGELIARAEKELERKKQKRREKEREKMLAKERAAQYVGILQEDVTTDEEEREMNEELKKAKKLLKKKDKEKKEREKETMRRKKREEEEERERRRKEKGKEKAKPRRLKPYPVDKPTSKTQKSSHTTPIPTPSRSISPPFPSFRPAGDIGRTSHRHGNSNNDIDIVQDYFNEIEVDMQGPDDDTPIDFNEPGPSDFASRAHTSTSPPRGTSPTLPAHSPIFKYGEVIELSNDEENDDQNAMDEVPFAMDKESLRALKKLYPRSMIKDMAAGKGNAQRKKVDRRPSLPMDVQGEDEDDGSLRPGQVRVRRLANASVRDVKGDTESENGSNPSSEDSSSDTGSEAVEILRAHKRSPLHASSRPEVEHSNGDDVQLDAISVPSSDSEDDDIRYFVQGAPPVRRKTKGSTRLKDQTLIDYMLQKDRASGMEGRRKSKKNKLGKSSGVRRSHTNFGYKYDVMTRDSRGHGREHQTLLSFDVHSTTKQPRQGSSQSREPNHRSGSGSSRPPMARSASKSSNATLFENGTQGHPAKHADLDPQYHQTVDVADDTKHRSRNWKEQQKRRRRRAKQNGVYNFGHGDSGGVGGDEGLNRNGPRRRDAGFMTVDLEDETFHRVLAPVGVINIGAMRYEPPDQAKRSRELKRAQSKNSGLGLSGVAEWAKGVEVPRHHNATSIVKKSPAKPHGFRYDLDIRPLTSGRSFSTNSYIRKGWLHDLLSCLTLPVENAAAPPSTTFCRLEFSVGMGIDLLRQVLPRLLDALHEAATDILEPELETLSEEWKPCIRITSQIVTSHIQNANEQERIAFKTAIEGEVLRCAAELEKHTTKHIEKPVLSLSWFLVELSVRCSKSLPTTWDSASSALQASCKALMRFLLRLGISPVTTLLKSEEVFDSSLPSPFHYATELWICLIHILLGFQDGNSPNLKSHPFWTPFIATLQAMPPENDSAGVFQFSEDIWLIIFALCALSQFSSNGITTTKPRLPASWSVVEVALKRISLLESAEQRNSDLEILKTRDQYVRILILRCTHLRHTWQWRMDESAPMFNTLAEVFRTRNFTILRHEEAGGEFRFTPKFFQKTDWALLDKHDPTDTTFAMFLKLVYLACHDEMNGGRKSQPKIKKLLSLTIPLRPLSFTKIPSPKEVSPLFNCLSAIAIAIAVDNSDQDDRINRARSYLPFTTADTKSKHRILVGIQRLAVLMIKKTFDLSALLAWFEDIVKAVGQDLKLVDTGSLSTQELQEQSSLRQASHIFSCASEMIKAFTHMSLYPDPQIFGKLRTLWGMQVFKHEALRKPFAILLKTLFAARTACLPVPPRPFRPIFQQADAEESQDYFADFQEPDLNDVALLDPEELVQSHPFEKQDTALRQILQSGNFMWQIYPHVKAYIIAPSSLDSFTKENIDDSDLWMRIWLHVADVTRTEAKWAKPLQLINDLLQTEAKTDNSRWARRFSLSMMFQLLQIDPMAYLDLKHLALDVFFRAIGSNSVALESQYVALLLSVDCLRHPAFAGLSDCLPPRDGDYQLSAEQFERLKIPMLRVIFANLEQSAASREQPHSPTSTDPVPTKPKPTDIDHCASMFSWMRETRTALENKFGRESDRFRTYNGFYFEKIPT
ncbi:Mus7/MMS22 family-domain-containing protein [Crepidotus variabilis]|uniref:Mus7/MMS22 family-domain-containing protein n=1 Tax=Crepidotus variabilis TaxID=179855 RepID=A0A9P6JJ38_9AGAR|nr:Mus7/MMS22 family-domain-containing protein [Crepidotus variabilis]